MLVPKTLDARDKTWPGPVLKLLGPLSDAQLTDDTIIVIGDDDSSHEMTDIDRLCHLVMEQPNVVAQADPNRKHTSSGLGIHGSNGFALRKGVCTAKDLQSFLLDDCFRVDDALLTAYFQSRGIPIIGVPVNRKSGRGLLNVNALNSPHRREEHNRCMQSIIKVHGFETDCSKCIL